VPEPPLPDDMLRILRRANPAVMATVRPDGAPVSVATWFLWEDDDQRDGHGRVLLSLDAGRARLEHLRHDPRVSLTVFDGHKWHRHVSLRGEVGLADDPHLVDVDRVSSHYTGRPYAIRDRPRVTAWMTVASYHAWPPGGW
jgi:PPOX class probable F420-dependent enzyme